MKKILIVATVLASVAIANAGSIRAVIIDGQNNHDWKTTTPKMKEILEETGKFSVDVATSPEKDVSGWNPQFKDYDVVVLNYNGEMWNETTQKAFLDYVSGGGGVVVVHAADNSFGKWKEYNEIIGIGGWGGRNKESGPYVYWKDGKLFRDYESEGPSGAHEGGAWFELVTRDTEHPITKGLPRVWMHNDELYNFMRGPGKNMHVLATGFSAFPLDKGGSQRHEPMLFTIKYGEGKVFHTMLGHDANNNMILKTFSVTFARGTEWAATGKVTIPVPDDFPVPHKMLSKYNETGPGGLLQTVYADIETYRGDAKKMGEIEMLMISYLNNDSLPFEAKQAVCDVLGAVGTTKSVSVLSSMLTKDAQSASMARLALERMPDKSAGKALLNALSKTSGKVKAGIVGSIGQRKDAKAVSALKGLALDGDAIIADSAVQALGVIGDKKALTALMSLSSRNEVEVQSAIIVCASGQEKNALKAYEYLLKNPAENSILFGAVKGLYVVDSKKALSRVWELLGSEQTAPAAVSALMSLPSDATLANAIAGKIGGYDGEVKGKLLDVLVSYKQSNVLPVLMKMAQESSGALQLKVVDAIGGIPASPASIEFLIKYAMEKDGDLKRRAADAVGRVPGVEADKAIIASLNNENRRLYMMDVIKYRRIKSAIPELLKYAADGSNEKFQKGAFDSLRDVAEPEHYKQVIDLAVKSNKKNLKSAARAVTSIGNKMSDNKKRADLYLDAIAKGDDDVKVALLGGTVYLDDPRAVKDVKKMAGEGSKDVQNAAYRAISKWVDPSVVKDLVTMAQQTDNKTYRILLMRAFGRLITQVEGYSDSDIIDACRKALAIGIEKGATELVLRVVADLGSGDALAFVTELKNKPEYKDAATRLEMMIVGDMIGNPVWTAFEKNKDFGRAFDGNVNSRWDCARGMEKGMWIMADFGVSAKANRLMMDSKNSPKDMPSAFDIYVFDDLKDQGAPDKNIKVPGNVFDMKFDDLPAGRYFKLVISEGEGGYWSIHEMSLDADYSFDKYPKPEMPKIKLADIMANSGRIDVWNIAGPFVSKTASSHGLLAKKLAPEYSDSLAVWEQVDKKYTDEHGVLRINKMSMHGDFRTAFLETVIVAEADTQVKANFWVDDECVFWLNDREVYRGSREDGLALDFKAGENVFKVKVVQHGGDWGMYLRLSE